MQIVIDIQDDVYKGSLVYKDVQLEGTIANDLSELTTAVANGIPLPKGHGKLIDADKLIKSIEKKSKRLKNLDTINGLCGAVALIYDAEVIIEADKVESEDKEVTNG